MTTVAPDVATAGAVAPGTSAGARLRRRERWTALLFLAPDVAGLAVFVGVPMVLSVVFGFFQISGFGQYEFVGFDNYRRMFADPLFFGSLRTTLLYVVALIPLLFVVSLALALLVKQKVPLIGVYRTLFFVPHVVSVVVLALMWRFLLGDQTGLLNRALTAVGLPAQSWLGDPDLALAAVVVITVWALMGYYMVIFLAGLQEIPAEYYEAARIDGASAWASFRTITWPLLKPTSFFVLLVSTVAAVTGGFDLIYILTKGGPANGTSVVIFYIYQQAFQFGEYGYAAAMGTFLVLIMLACSSLIFALTKGGRFTYGDD